MSARTLSVVVAAAAVAVSGTAFAQPELEIASIDPEDQFLERITELQSGGGRAPAASLEPLRALALFYQEEGSHALAIAALEEARHVTRVHQGLSSVDEALLLKQQIRSEEAFGNHERVWNLEQDMLTIARQHHDDIRTVPIFRALADDRLDILARYHSGEIPPEVRLGCYYAAGLPRYDDTRGERRAAFEGSCTSGSKSDVMARIRTETLLYYADAIEAILKTGDYASEELRELEQQALRIGFDMPYPVLPSFGNAVTGSVRPTRIRGHCSSDTLDALLALELLGTCLQPVIHAPNAIVIANVGSWVSLVRLLSYEIRSGAPAAARATALAELADWHLLSTPPGRRRFDAGGRRALELYGRLYRELQASDEVRASTTQIFSPQVPVTLPTFVPNPFVTATTAESPRYVDVAFAVSQYGRGERVEILATSKDATRAEEKDVTYLIEGSTFRPRVVDGELAASAPVVLRYYLTPRSLQDARDVRLRLCERAGVCLL
jgi:tetratricopeptide (TPR) repeat protein